MAAADLVQAVDTLADFGSDEAAVARRWISEVQMAQKGQNQWAERAKKIIRRYREERPSAEAGAVRKRYAILWSNVQTLGPAIYANTPQAVVSRRFKDDDPVGRVASEVLERAANYALEAYDFDGIIESARDEYLLLARGQAWVRYEPHFKTIKTPVDPVQEVADDGAQISDDVEREAAPEATQYTDATGQTHDADKVQHDDEAGHYVEEEHLDYEEVRCDHVAWDDFLTNPARTWAEVRWCARRAYLTRDELKERFTKAVPDQTGKTVGDVVPLDFAPDKEQVGEAATSDAQFKKAAVWEIWNKDDGKVYWVSLSFNTAPLDVRPDPLRLDEFFPCPRPLLGTTAPDSTIPIPDYVYYQDQAEELDDLTGRIARLTDALRVNGFYAGQQDSKLQQLLKPGQENKLIPIDDWSALKGDGGVAGLIEWFPVEQVAAVLKHCLELRAKVIEDIYQITGVADILRGASDPRETAAAQGIKAQWGALRVRDRQKEISRFARDLIRIKGQIIAGKFTVETLKAMTGLTLLDSVAEKQQLQQQMQMQGAGAAAPGPAGAPSPGTGGAPNAAGGGTPTPPPAVPPELQRLLAAPTWEEVSGLLQNKAMRAFRIDIETDSTIEPNEQDEKARRVEFIQAFGAFIAASLPVVQAAPQMMPAIGEAMKFLARGFRVSREMEDIIDKVAASVGAAPPTPSPGPDPTKQLIEQAKVQVAQMRAQSETARTQAQTQIAQGDQVLEHGRQQIEGREIALRAHELHLKTLGVHPDQQPPALPAPGPGAMQQ